VDAGIIRQGELVGRTIMAYETAEDVGTVEHLLVDVKLAQVVGLVCKSSGLMGRRQSLSWSQLVNIGRDSLVVHAEASPSLVAASESQLAAAQSMTDLELWTDGGDHIGRVVDLCCDRTTGEVQQYLFVRDQASAPGGALVSLPTAEACKTDDPEAESAANDPASLVSLYAIAPQTLISAGRKRMMISEEAARRSQPFGPPVTLESLQRSLQPAAHSSPPWRAEQLPEMPTDFGELLQKGQSFAGRVSEQVRQRAKQFADEQLAHPDSVEADSLADITEQLQAKTAHVKQQMQAQFKKASQKAREKAQDQIDGDWVDRLGSTPIGQSLGQTLNKFKRSSHTDQSEPIDPIDVASFEVWEDD
jgi:uncharacterized protein YrrD